MFVNTEFIFFFALDHSSCSFLLHISIRFGKIGQRIIRNIMANTCLLLRKCIDGSGVSGGERRLDFTRCCLGHLWKPQYYIVTPTNAPHVNEGGSGNGVPRGATPARCDGALSRRRGASCSGCFVREYFVPVSKDRHQQAMHLPQSLECRTHGSYRPGSDCC